MALFIFSVYLFKVYLFIFTPWIGLQDQLKLSEIRPLRTVVHCLFYITSVPAFWYYDIADILQQVSWSNLPKQMLKDFLSALTILNEIFLGEELFKGNKQMRKASKLNFMSFIHVTLDIYRVQIQKDEMIISANRNLSKKEKLRHKNWNMNNFRVPQMGKESLSKF